jgi:hypothetical protein
MNCKDTVYYLRGRERGLRLLTDFNMHLSDDPKWDHTVPLRNQR